MEEPDRKRQVLRVLDMKYKISYTFTLVLGLFYMDPDFSRSDPNFWPIRIRTQKKSLIRIREKNPDPKHWFRETIPLFVPVPVHKSEIIPDSEH